MKAPAASAIFEERSDGTLYVRSNRPLEAHPVTLTERLDLWAHQIPERTFLAQRLANGAWRHLTYAETLQRVRSIAQTLLALEVSYERPLPILSGNSIEHALLALGCLYVGVPYAPVSPSLFAENRAAYSEPLAETISATPTSEVDEAHARISADTVAKILFTSGSTGRPKGVVTTQRMLCSNQQMIRMTLNLSEDDPLVLCDWLPWRHVFGGSHNFGMALYNGGTLFIDEGKPTPTGFATTLTNLREIATTIYLNVPQGYAMLVPELRADPVFNRHFFSRLRILFCAAAGLSQHVIDDLRELSRSACGRDVPLMMALGATESAPMALATGTTHVCSGHVGLPVPGVELKLVPRENAFEARLRGPNITPGYWKAPQETAEAFDDEGFYRLGDTLMFVDREAPLRGFLFEGRIDEDFKLSTGVWVRVHSLRTKFLAHFAGLLQDVVFAGPDQDYVTALVLPASTATVLQVQHLLSEFARAHPALSTRVRHALLIEDRANLMGKGTLNQKHVLQECRSLAAELYAGSPRVIVVPDSGGRCIP